MKDLTLNKFIIDVVQPNIDTGAHVQLISYMVLAPTAEEAMRRFFDEEQGSIIYEGDIVDRILIGIQEAAE